MLWNLLTYLGDTDRYHHHMKLWRTDSIKIQSTLITMYLVYYVQALGVQRCLHNAPVICSPAPFGAAK